MPWWQPWPTAPAPPGGRRERADARPIEGAAPPNCRFTGEIDDAQLRWLYESSQGLVTASHEDLGLTPIESMAFGRPVVALRADGFLKTLQEGTTAVFFDSLDSREIAGAIETAAYQHWNPRCLATQAARFDPGEFTRRRHEVVERCAPQTAVIRPARRQPSAPHPVLAPTCPSGLTAGRFSVNRSGGSGVESPKTLHQWRRRCVELQPPSWRRVMVGEWPRRSPYTSTEGSWPTPVVGDKVPAAWRWMPAPRTWRRMRAR